MAKKYDTPPPHTEAEASEIRKKNAQRQDDATRRKLKIRREIEARREAKELGITFEEFMGGQDDESI